MKSEHITGPVYVVVASSYGFDPPVIAGVYAVKSHANEARRLANIQHGRTPATMGAFRVVTTEVSRMKPVPPPQREEREP